MPEYRTGRLEPDGDGLNGGRSAVPILGQFLERHLERAAGVRLKRPRVAADGPSGAAKHDLVFGIHKLETQSQFANRARTGVRDPRVEVDHRVANIIFRRAHSRSGDFDLGEVSSLLQA